MRGRDTRARRTKRAVFSHPGVRTTRHELTVPGRSEPPDTIGRRVVRSGSRSAPSPLLIRAARARRAAGGELPDRGGWRAPVLFAPVAVSGRRLPLRRPQLLGQRLVPAMAADLARDPREHGPRVALEWGHVPLRTADTA